jgi:ribosome-binding factor A
LLLKLIKVYVNRYTHLFAESMLKDIQAAGLDNILFAWAGTTINQVGSPTYYRVQGPTFIIEYDNTQNNANHIHSVIRDLKNDFGGDALLNHYKQGHTQ